MAVLNHRYNGSNAIKSNEYDHISKSELKLIIHCERTFFIETVDLQIVIYCVDGNIIV